MPPYTLIDFGSIPEYTRFVQAYEYANSQEELPLGLSWEAAYRDLTAPEPDNAWASTFGGLRSVGFMEMVKLEGWGLHLNGISWSNISPETKVITGPPLTDLPDYGGQIPEGDIEILQELMTTQFGRAAIEDFITVQNLGRLLSLGARRILGQRCNRLRERKLIDMTGGNIYLTNFGKLRVAQERLKL